MQKSLLILLSGLPASGKTTIGTKIAQKYNFPFIQKDMIKETLADSLHVFDKEWSKKLGLASRQVSTKIVETILASKVSCILEGNFYPNRDTGAIKSIQKKNNCNILQILCKTKSNILIKRFGNRLKSGKRHNIHLDHHLPLKLFETELKKEKLPPLSIDSIIIEIDTENLDDANLQEIDDAIIKITKPREHKLFNHLSAL